MALTNIEQSIKGGEESICKTCAHNRVCRYMDNQPCIECSQYAEQEPQWISVEKSLPNEWEPVLVWSCCGYIECAVWLGIPGKWRCTWDHTLLDSEITHWMPLPEPPDGAKMAKEAER